MKEEQKYLPVNFDAGPFVLSFLFIFHPVLPGAIERTLYGHGFRPSPVREKKPCMALRGSCMNRFDYWSMSKHRGKREESMHIFASVHSN